MKTTQKRSTAPKTAQGRAAVSPLRVPLDQALRNGLTGLLPLATAHAVSLTDNPFDAVGSAAAWAAVDAAKDALKRRF